jgi:general secretion pathway protein J
MTHPRADSGFTLMEMLISITILGVILTIIMGGLRIGTRAWETGTRDVESRQRLQIVLTLIKNQLGAACPENIRKPEVDPYVFRGDDRSMEWISRVSIVPGNDHGKVYVNYRIIADDGGGWSLTAAEQSLVRLGPDDERFFVADADFYELISGARRVAFEYLGPSVDGIREWTDIWDPENRDGWPAAVRVSLQINEKEPLASIVARFHAEPEES